MFEYENMYSSNNNVSFSTKICSCTEICTFSLRCLSLSCKISLFRSFCDNPSSTLFCRVISLSPPTLSQNASAHSSACRLTSSIGNCLKQVGHSIFPSVSVDRASASALNVPPEVQLGCSYSTGCSNS